MKQRLAMVWWSAAFAAIGLSFISKPIIEPIIRGQDLSAVWRYKLTIRVTTPEGIREGSTIREVHADLGPNRDKAVDWYAIGEAAVVELGQDRRVYGLLRGVRGDSDHPETVFAKAFPCRESKVDCLNYYSNLKSTEVLSSENIPMLVAFETSEDPTRVKRLSTVISTIDAGGWEQHRLDNSGWNEFFGEGIVLDSALIEMNPEESRLCRGKVALKLSTWGGFRSVFIGEGHSPFAPIISDYVGYPQWIQNCSTRSSLWTRIIAATTQIWTD